MKPSVVILAKNEEASIKRCIKSVKSLASELVVVDDESSDETAKIAKEEGAKVVLHKLNDFASQRALGDEQVKGDWILHIDADEELSLNLQKEIRELSESGNLAYYLRRREFFWATEVKHGEVAVARHRGFLRLYKRGSGSWNGAVHETFVTDVETRRLDEFIDHRPHQNIAEFLTDINYYSTIRASELKDQGVTVNMFMLTVQPIAKFLHAYFLKIGFKDGPAGFVYAFMMSFHSFLARAKLYLLTS